MNNRQWIVIVLDGLGAGAMPDAAEYGDEGTDTLRHLLAATHSVADEYPELSRWGLAQILNPAATSIEPLASVGKMAEQSRGKDSTTGHWELAGVVTRTPFPTYPDGFPADVQERFLQLTGLHWLGNRVASGTAIIQDLGDEHVRTGDPIVYTSADSVFQIAAHEEVIPLPRLYEICRICREQLLVGDHAVSRVIARPFTGTSGHYTRTANRRDFSLKPTGVTLLDLLQKEGVETIGIGKIGDLYAEQGLDEIVHTHSNAEGMERLLEIVARPRRGNRFIMVNLVDFDMLWGHRRDLPGYQQGLREFDRRLPQLRKAVDAGTTIVLTADHGNDPLHTGSDHTREYVPILVFRPGFRGTDLGTRESFTDLAVTVADSLDIDHDYPGTSFWPELNSHKLEETL